LFLLPFGRPGFLLEVLERRGCFVVFFLALLFPRIFPRKPFLTLPLLVRPFVPRAFLLAILDYSNPMQHEKQDC
jgi:hypothetical protein